MGYAELLDSVLRRTHAVLEANGVWHCLIFGTLLGAVRGGAIIEWDHDFDLLVRREDVARILELEDAFAAEDLRIWHGRKPAAGLALNPGRLPWYDHAALCVMTGDWTFGELWAPTVFSDGVLRNYDLEHEVVSWPESSFAAYFVEELGSVTLGGVEYPVPRDAEELLCRLYGADWRTPYRSRHDGGEGRAGSTAHGTVAAPALAEQIEWCLEQGWDRSRYSGAPAWPRRLAGAGPRDPSGRAAGSSGSAWWHSLGEIATHY